MTCSSIWIDRDEVLADYCKTWMERSFIVLDTEFIRETTYYPIPGLIQIGDEERVFLVDPCVISDWRPFVALLEATSVVKVLHACSEDIEVLLQLTAVVPVPLFDTQLAAAYCGMDYSMGYSRLVKDLLGVELTKGETRSNWLQRPLTPLQRQYAEADVIYLAKVYAELDGRLSVEKLNRLYEDTAELGKGQLMSARLDPDTLYRECRQGWRLSGAQLAILRVLYGWRERQARQRNQARNRLLKESALFLLAKMQPSSLAALAQIPDIHPRTVRQDGEQLLEIIRESARLPADSQPALLPEPLPPSAKPLLQKLKAVARQVAQEEGMAPELMLRKNVLEQLVRSGDSREGYRLPDSLAGWRRELLGPLLMTVLREEGV